MLLTKEVVQEMLGLMCEKLTRNVAVMINGIPVNDMENGWVSGLTGMVLLMSLAPFKCKGLSAQNLAALLVEEV